MDSKSWGRVFREIREMKNLSLAKVAGDYENSPNFITSKVQLSRFERGESDITLGKIVPLVKNLGITFEEYLAHIRNFAQSEQSLFIEKLEHQSELENFREIENLYQSAIQNFEKLGEPFFHWSALEAKAILASHQIKNYHLTEQEIQEVADYLFSIENWDKSEIFLFGELLDFFNEKLVYEFTMEILHRNNYYQKNPRNKEYVILLLKSVIVYFIDRKNKESARIFLEEYHKVINSPIIDIHNQKEFMTLEGLYCFMIGEYDKGKIIFNNLSKAYRSLGYNELSEYMKKIIKEKTKNRNK